MIIEKSKLFVGNYVAHMHSRGIAGIGKTPFDAIVDLLTMLSWLE